MVLRYQIQYLSSNLLERFQLFGSSRMDPELSEYLFPKWNISASPLEGKISEELPQIINVSFDIIIKKHTLKDQQSRKVHKYNYFKLSYFSLRA